MSRIEKAARFAGLVLISGISAQSKDPIFVSEGLIQSTKFSCVQIHTGSL